MKKILLKTIWGFTNHEGALYVFSLQLTWVNCDGLGTTMTVLSCSTPVPSGSCKNILKFFISLKPCEKFSLCLSSHLLMEAKSVQTSQVRLAEGWQGVSSWQVSHRNFMGTPQAGFRLQNLMRLLSFSWENLDVKDDCLTITCCSAGRTYSPKYFYFHYLHSPEQEQRHSAHIQSTDCRVVSNAWDGFKIHSGYSGIIVGSAGEAGWRKMPAAIALGTM